MGVVLRQLSKIFLSTFPPDAITKIFLFFIFTLFEIAAAKATAPPGSSTILKCL